MRINVYGEWSINRTKYIFHKYRVITLGKIFCNLFCFFTINRDVIFNYIFTKGLCMTSQTFKVSNWATKVSMLCFIQGLLTPTWNVITSSSSTPVVGLWTHQENVGDGNGICQILKFLILVLLTVLGFGGDMGFLSSEFLSQTKLKSHWHWIRWKKATECFMKMPNNFQMYCWSQSGQQTTLFWNMVFFFYMFICEGFLGGGGTSAAGWYVAMSVGCVRVLRVNIWEALELFLVQVGYKLLIWGGQLWGVACEKAIKVLSFTPTLPWRGESETEMGRGTWGMQWVLVKDVEKNGRRQTTSKRKKRKTTKTWHQPIKSVTVGTVDFHWSACEPVISQLHHWWLRGQISICICQSSAQWQAMVGFGGWAS